MALAKEYELTAERVALFKTLGGQAAAGAAAALTDLVGHDVQLSQINSGLLRVETLMEMTGNPENAAIGIYARVEGDAPGHAAFLLPYWKAPALVAALTGREMGTMRRPDPHSSSYLREVGSALMKAALSALADATGLVFEVGQPMMAIDMAWAIVSSVVSFAQDIGKQAMIVATRFGGDENILDGLFLFIPDAGSLETIEASQMRLAA